MAKIFLVEDDNELRGLTEDWLTHEHYEVEAVGNGKEAQERLKFYEYDLVVLDWELPEIDGIDILKEFRQSGGTTPVLMLTGKKTVSDKEQGLDSGADDYLPKPFHMKELSARVRALLRRSTHQISNILQAGNIVLDPTSFTVTKNGADIRLPRREFALLEFLMRNPRRVFSPEALLERVWASESDATAEALRTCLKRLRSKIDTEGNDSMIQTVHGVGYKLEPP